MPDIPLRISRTIICKKQESYATTISWVWAKVSFAILQSTLPFLTGLRTPRRRNLDTKHRDLEIEKGQAGLPQTQQLQMLYYWNVHGNFNFVSLQTVVHICSVENHQITKKYFNYQYILNMYLIFNLTGFVHFFVNRIQGLFQTFFRPLF